MEHRNDKHPPIWEQLNTKKVGDNAASDIQLVSDPVHLQYSNRQTLGDIALVNAATMRDGLPIPNTGKIVVHTATDNTVEIVFRPASGEVWAVLGADASTFGTGQNAATLFLSDGTTDMVIADSSSAGDMNDHGFRTGIYIDYNMFLAFQPNNISSGTAVLEVALIRVR